MERLGILELRKLEEDTLTPVDGDSAAFTLSFLEAVGDDLKDGGANIRAEVEVTGYGFYLLRAVTDFRFLSSDESSSDAEVIPMDWDEFDVSN